MDRDARLLRMKDEWCALDDAVIRGGLTEMRGWPWESRNPAVQAAWEALTRPEHLADLAFKLADNGGGHGMNQWAEAVTRKAIEVSRSRAGTSSDSGSPPPIPAESR